MSPRAVLVLACALAFTALSLEAQSEVLIYDTSLSQTALSAANSLSLSVVHTTSEGEFFDTIFDPGQSFDLLICEIPDGPIGDDFAFTIHDFVEAGGRAILSYAEIASGASDGELLRAAFGVEVAVDYASPLDIEATDPSHPIWTTPNSVVPPIVPAFDPWGLDGAAMTPVPGGVSPANFPVVGPMLPNGAVIIRSGNQAIVNGFNFDSYEIGDLEPFIVNQIEFLLSSVPATPEFTRGDANVDGAQDISDAVFSLAALFTGGAPGPVCDDSADANDDGGFDISDPVYSLAQLFSSGPNPPPPFPGCGTDPTDDALDCSAFPACP